jgi:hypothetical protein
MKDFKDSLESVLAFSSKDWSVSADDAWIYGIVLGWNEECLLEMSSLHGWSPETITKLKKLHNQFKNENANQRVFQLEEKVSALYNLATDLGACPEYLKVNFAN